LALNASANADAPAGDPANRVEVYPLFPPSDLVPVIVCRQLWHMPPGKDHRISSLKLPAMEWLRSAGFAPKNRSRFIDFLGANGPMCVNCTMLYLRGGWPKERDQRDRDHHNYQHEEAC
jgi:hypothetical protein